MPFLDFRLSIMAILFSFGSYAQQFGYTNYSVKDGLLSSTVYCVVQDSVGRLWFGTQYGVSIFNGNKFENIDRDQGLKDTEVFLMHPDKKGRMWLISFSNNLCYYSEGKIKYVRYVETRNEPKINTTRGVREDSHGNIWLLGRYLHKATEDSVFQIDKDWYSFTFDILEKQKSIYSISSSGVLPIINNVIHDSIIGLYNPEKDNIRGLVRIGDKEFIYGANTIREIGYNMTGQIVEKPFLNFGSYINRARFIDDRYLWVLTLEGATCIDFVTKDTLKYLEGKSISDVFVDQEKNIWLTTLTDGVFRFNNNGIRIIDRSSGIKSGNITTVTGNQNSIWFGTNNGSVYKMNGDERNEVLTLNPENTGRILDLSLKNKKMYSATDIGLFSIDEEENDKIELLLKGAVKSVSATGELVVAGTPSFTFLLNGTEMKRLPWYGRSTCIYIYPDSSFAIGTLEGLYFSHVRADKCFVKKNYELNERINYIESGNDSILWVATHSAGIFAFDGKRKYRFSHEDGLLSNACRHIFINPHNNEIWISTNKGINRITIHNLQQNRFSIVNYTEEDGLPTDDINQCFVRNDTLWAATSNGLAIVQYNRKSTIHPPEIYINSLVSDNILYNDFSSLSFSHNHNNIEVNFSGQSLSAGQLIKYNYRLVGLDNAWHTTSENSIRYAGLVPGKYQFEIYAVHPKGIVSDIPAVLSFTIENPFWLTWWFMIITGVVVVFTVSIIFIYRMKQIKKEEGVKNKILQAQITSLRSQMNPHFIFNSLNSIQDFIFKNEKQHANEYLSSFATLIRLVLDNSAHNYTTVAKECEFLELYLKLERLRMNSKFDYIISVDKEINTEFTEIPTMLVQPLVENALLHGIAPKKEKCLLKINFEQRENGAINCVIEDNGVGRQKVSAERAVRKHTSFGLHAIMERVKILNSMKPYSVDFSLIDLKDVHGFPSGTSVQFTITQT